MYEVSLDDVMFPIAPSSIEIKIKNKNKTTVLVDDGEINILKTPGLTDIKFDVLLPSVKYPFAVYKDGFKPSGYYTEHIKKLKQTKKPFIFKVVRKFPDGVMLFGYSMKVSLEDYVIKEDANNGFDVVVSINLKEYRDYGTKIGTVTFNQVDKQTEEETKEVEPVLNDVKPARQDDNSPINTGKNIVYYTTSGISIYELSKKYYGSIMYSNIIEQANKRFIENGIIKNGYIQPNTSVVIPELKDGNYVDKEFWNLVSDGEIIVEQQEKIDDSFLIHYVDGVPYL